MSRRKYKDPISKSVHELISGMHEVGVVNKTTMREFDKSCLVDSPPGANEIRRVRLANSASQAVFAKHIGVTTGLVSKWERGTAAPRGASLRALTAIGNAGLNVVRQSESAIRYRYKSESTSKKVATAASKVLSNPKASKAEKSVAASALTQKGSTEKTSSKVASSASKVLSNPKASKAAKSAAASALTQKSKKK